MFRSFQPDKSRKLWDTPREDLQGKKEPTRNTGVKYKKKINTLRHNYVWQDDSFVFTIRHALFRLRDSTGYGQGSNRCSEQLRGYAVHGNLK